MSNAIQIITFPIMGGTETGGLGTIPVVGTVLLFKAPSAALGGGITITEAAITSRDTGLGTFQLLKIASGTPGTIGVNGTLSSAFGTNSIAAGTTYAMTIPSGGSAFVGAGEWVALSQSGSIKTPGAQIYIAYQMGRG
jgi:hypothetical protein